MIHNELKIVGRTDVKVGIMQPYFLPYVGYFQLISAVDIFVLYDNIKYTKKGWINRNRMLRNNQEVIFSLPLKNASDQTYIADRLISDEFDGKKLYRQFEAAYKKAPYFSAVQPLLQEILSSKERNLFQFLSASIKVICHYLEISTRILTSSDFESQPQLSSQDRVISVCRDLQATQYINPIGGIALYSKVAFIEQGIALHFLQSRYPSYTQFGADFLPWLSIIDVLMFNSRDSLMSQLPTEFELI